MAELSKWAIFCRAFIVSLLVGAPATTQRALASDASDWRRATQSGSAESYIWYLRRNPAGEHIDDAIKRLIELDAIDSGSGATRDLNLY